MTQPTDQTSQGQQAAGQADQGQQAAGQADQGTGGGFTAPKDQAEFDRMVGERLTRERAKFADYAELKTKAAEHDKTVEAQKTEAQKLTDRAAAAEAKAIKAERDALVAQTALDKGLTSSQAKRLVGNTKDELTADADELLKDLGKVGGNQTGGQSTSFDNGARSTAGTSKGDAGLEEARKRFPDKYATKT